MTRRKSRFTAALCALFLSALLLAGQAGAAEIEGTVTAVLGDTVTIALESDLVPNVGDKVEISFKTADDQIPVGIWRVSKVDGATVTATVVEAEGEATIDMTAVIFSETPRPKQTVAPDVDVAKVQRALRRAGYEPDGGCKCTEDGG